MATARVLVKIRTNDMKWAQANGLGVKDEGDGFALVTIEVPTVERVTFAGRDMVRFDLGAKRPHDHQRWAMYPASYVVA